MPSSGESPPELIARFGELAALAPDADRREVFGHLSCVLRGNMFMGLYEGSLVLRLPSPTGASSSAVMAAGCSSPCRAGR